MKIGCFSSSPIIPLHVRTETNISILQEKHNIHLIYVNQNEFPKRGINKIFFNFFALNAIFKLKKELTKYDIIYIQNLDILPLALFAKNKIVIYETLDNNVHLKWHNLKNRYKYIRLLFFFPNLFSLLEKWMAFNYCSKIIVNSLSLHSYFKKKSHLLFYTSPFEKIEHQNNPENKSALLYLGYFSNDKGAYEVIDLQLKLNIPLFIFGAIENTSILNKIKLNSQIQYFPKLGSNELKNEIEKLLKQYFLFGVSLIKPTNLSYATQEANKDIDYLSIGIPIIGNHRIPTFEKIKSGCGILIENTDEIKNTINNTQNKFQLSKNCIEYYQNNYSFQLYKTILTSVFN